MDKKLTDNDIKSHLEWLKTVVDRVDSITNGKEFISIVIDRINYLEAKCEELQGIIVNYNSNLAKQVAENERLKENLNIELENFASEYDSKIKAEAYKELVGLIKDEITDAIISNGTAIKERVEKHNVNRYEDKLCVMCDGKVSALVGIEDFIDNLLKELVGDK